ncbi:MAG TPA: NAD-dependent epimerase/dehydratase family protein [Candidatus Hydrogenedentes bacterium]|nr:NAD-dependent epimerase/dehydratase family protein [Candidatus Hydrogenedentota bacterium]
MSRDGDARNARMDGTSVLITGGLGFIGSNLAHRCVASGATVTLLDSNPRFKYNITGIERDVTVVEGDIRDSAVVAESVKGQDVIFHFAGQTSHTAAMAAPHADLEVNCGGTLNVLEAARVSCPEAAIVFAGTVTAAGRARSIPADEAQQDVPVNVYDAHKLTCEKYMSIYAHVYGMRTVTLRLANVFGERQRLGNPRRGILNYFIGRAILGKPITLYGDGALLRDYNYVQNVVDACVSAVQSPETRGHFYVVGSGRGISVKEMAGAVNEAVERAFGKATTIEHVAFPEGEEVLDAGDYVADAGKFRAATGWHPRVPFEEGLARTVAFVKQNVDVYLEENHG